MNNAQGQSNNRWPQQLSHQEMLAGHSQQILDNNKTASNQSKPPIVMASNHVFSIGPYRQRKDSTRISVLQKYEIIGYIAAGTYGKVYKAKAREYENNTNRDDVIVLDSPDSSGTDSNLDVHSINRSTRQQEANDTLTTSDFRKPSHKRFTPQNNGTSTQIRSNSGSDPNVRINSSSIVNDSRKPSQIQFYAIKKFKTEREGVEHYTGISQSACREMSLCRELDNNHLTKLVEIFLEKKSIYMVSEFAEHDLLQIIHFHSHPEKRLIPPRMLKSIIWQILDGVSYLHQNWILHRDLKPANIMVTVDGCVKIGDLGLARKFNNMVQTLYTGDKVVVTIWYRAPELILGARHYTPAIDLWAVGCIFAELIGLRPIFKGEEAKMESKKSVLFQANQFQRILEVVGSPDHNIWPNIDSYPEYPQLEKMPKYRDSLATWYQTAGGKDKAALDILYRLLQYDPVRRIDAINALDHEYFTNGDPPVCENVFDGLNYKYPPRRIHTNDNDITNVGNDASQSSHSQKQPMHGNNNNKNQNMNGLGVNKRILAAAAAAAAAAAVSGNGNISSANNTANGGSARKKRK
ncbi:unnamed protein product [Kluyveromyces dobzhanskii CBS 2104]|uniref:Cyclin-dependent kinase 8 n=1 Tax=Kluyveromyces dobzhanskii CBS 2104 TaxID=1427455 RepID=A0A0A8L4L5_9SACH|nr:unnamed protein product [Kluyveromyces dobzhanskii CBS 2104]